MSENLLTFDPRHPFSNPECLLCLLTLGRVTSQDLFAPLRLLRTEPALI